MESMPAQASILELVPRVPKRAMMIQEAMNQTSTTMNHRRSEFVEFALMALRIGSSCHACRGHLLTALLAYVDETGFGGWPQGVLAAPARYRG